MSGKGLHSGFFLWPFMNVCSFIKLKASNWRFP